MDPLTIDKDFNMLSMQDLLYARDLYHLHLVHKKNVIATAVGRYLIRRHDHWPKPRKNGGNGTNKNGAAEHRGRRGLDNSEVRPYSWPCIIVFVKEWIDTNKFGKEKGDVSYEDMVPNSLYLPDGRVVPVCVVEAPLDENVRDAVDVGQLAFPRSLIGGGYPMVADVQAAEHVASIGCLVSDGHLVYALTNRHVSGAPGEKVYSWIGGEKVEIGKSTRKQITRLPFEKVYDKWPGKNVYVNLDIGLVEVSDINYWTTQIYGIGQMGKLADLSIDNISLRLIGCPVRAYGCASGRIFGTIYALFYRYKSVGGFDYVSDFLIGPRKLDEDKNVPFTTQPGDSGTVWLLETEAENTAAIAGQNAKDREKLDLLPIAVQWGGHVFVEGATKKQYPYALATCLSTVCNLLEVDLIRDWDIGAVDYWGAVGHYTIANKACDVIKNKSLKQLMIANRDRISFEVGDINKKDLNGLSKRKFVPMADVPDMVWKIGTSLHGNRGEPEHPNHFADMDKPMENDLTLPDGTVIPAGTHLLDICTDKKGNVIPERVDVDVWRAYYTEVGDESRGLLPFRVWEFYQNMVKFVKAGDVNQFVAAAGIVSHYVGNACQPLHISFMFNGDPNDQVPGVIRDRKTGEKKDGMVPRAAGVHSAYEDDMVNNHVADIMVGVGNKIAKKGPLPTIKGGHGAAVAVVQLMKDTFDTIQPKDIVDEFVAVKDQKPKQIAEALWAKFGNDTIEVISEGCRFLAMIWDSAWKEGGGKIKQLVEIPEDTLIKIYQKHTFIPSMVLDKIGPQLR